MGQRGVRFEETNDARCNRKEATDLGGKGWKQRRQAARREGDGGWFQGCVESAGVRAINLAGISELMNVIKIQPPAS